MDVTVSGTEKYPIPGDERLAVYITIGLKFENFFTRCRIKRVERIISRAEPDTPVMYNRLCPYLPPCGKLPYPFA